MREEDNVQLPSRVTELGTGLAQVEVKNLDNKESASRAQSEAAPACTAQDTKWNTPNASRAEQNQKQQDAIGKQFRAARGLRGSRRKQKKHTSPFILYK